jgi:hypothetical protein
MPKFKLIKEVSKVRHVYFTLYLLWFNFILAYIRVVLISVYTGQYCEPGSSVSMVSGYGLDGQAIEVRSPAEAKGFSSSLCFQTGCGAHQSLVQWVLWVLFQWLKRSRGVTLTTHPHLAPRSRMSGSYTSSPHKRFLACSEAALA